MQDRGNPRISSEGLKNMTLQELKQNQKASLDAAEALLKTAEAANRGLTASENERYETHMADVRSWGMQAKRIEAKNTIRLMMNTNGTPKWLHDDGAFTGARAGALVPFPIQQAETHNPAYAASLHAFLSTGGKAHSEELTAGADGNGGYYIPGSETYTQQRKPNGSFPNRECKQPRMKARTAARVQRAAMQSMSRLSSSLRNWRCPTLASLTPARSFPPPTA
jgi:hypothetical protein